jgi:DNA repair protein RadA/Sms
MAAKTLTTVYVCESCGNESPLWAGKCPSCGQWNTLKELKLSSKTSKSASKTRDLVIEPVSRRIIQNKTLSKERILSGILGLDTALGGGFVPGEVVLVAGEPGIGKSTLLLAACLNFAVSAKTAIYFSAEESEDQVINRLQRISTKSEKDLDNLYIQYESSVENIVAAIEKYDPAFVVVDSIQAVASDNIDSSAGNLSQVRQSALILAEVAKRKGTVVVIVGQVTKEGMIAGPKVIEHLVDCVLKFEGDKLSDLRVLRSTKNRFGSTDEVSFFAVGDKGVIEISDPSKFFISDSGNVSGVAKSIVLQGNRPILVEVQALINKSSFGYPKRLSEGYSRNRLELLAAIVQKRLGQNLSDHDIYVKVLGGLTVKDPAIDLAVIAAMISVFKDKPLSNDLVFLGEVSLSGQVLGVARAEFRIKEALKSGAKKIIAGKIADTKSKQIISCSNLTDFVKAAF